MGYSCSAGIEKQGRTVGLAGGGGQFLLWLTFLAVVVQVRPPYKTGIKEKIVQF